jgi:predicted nucleotidyltransferase
MSAMAPILAQHLRGIEDLCRKYAVECLEAFGSVTGPDFDPTRSDVDFLVLFGNHARLGSADQLLGLLADLEQLLGRKVDLVNMRAARNPYFIADALRHRVRLYAA